MTNGYIVRYYISNKRNNPYKLWIFAHDAEQAKNLCLVQAGHRHGYGFKITITGVDTEDNAKREPVKKPTPELGYKELLASIKESNQIVEESLKHIGKKRKKSFLERLIG